MRDKRTLVFCGGKFGLEFSGGCIATCRIFEYVQHAFDEVVVLSNELGMHNIRNLRHIPIRDNEEAIPILRGMNQDECVFYGDFWDAIVFVEAKLPFYFTYHDNWPEQAQLNQVEADRKPHFIALYQRIFEHAVRVFSVSEYKQLFIRKYTDRVSIIRNGTNHPIQKETYTPFVGGTFRIVMTGNIDERKYGKALPLFEWLANQKLDLSVDIFGWENDEDIARGLSDSPFVNIKGYQKDIDLRPYDMYLSTSFIENLSISVVEALQNHLPVICFDVGGLKEVVNSNNGFVIPPFEIPLMGEAIKSIVQSEVQFDFDQTTLDDFDWQVAGKRFLECLDEDS